ncbi:5-oxoprolinase subunit PxpA [Pseudoalteromonas sp. L23]|uniref:5-oxoprolinase subunit PxpA n=1 Tax=unclassified Pseudoalteromonas TaxID=194690 RepID=UPI001EEF9150|nr:MULTISPECIES: 5-oxoprolinase subunit PxpA [unclassified Pseudoalteromonas]MCF7516367.1 5-oxoprolinase subunit PxpA [Pseudoalteromonas sp. L7]MCF7528414.1 5-oxoprolinase subunit PxpA [Pseudoalteromonas sp. L23]MCX2767910.1 5-oxoprolinase subunit PxpA [Pseudoalteromonas sp. B530]
MLLNCDLGESFGAWKMGLDEHVMPHIDMANVACGFHAGDPDVLAQTLKLVNTHQVTLGAHPSYPDRQGFGRRSMQLSEQEIINALHYQIAAIEGMAKVQDLTLSYVKPHGALYNDMMKSQRILSCVIKAISHYPSELKLMVLATAQQTSHQQLADDYNVSLIFEAFADRLYTDEGLLTPRSEAGAVHDKSALLAQVKQLHQQGSVTTASGKSLALRADTLCVHGDNEASIALIEEIRNVINQ